MSNSSGSANISIGFGGALFLLFLGLRLTDHIDWAWYWVAAPLWMPLGLFLAIIAVAGLVMLVASPFRRKRTASMRRGKQ
jgi:hypothetical protein